MADTNLVRVCSSAGRPAGDLRGYYGRIQVNARVVGHIGTRKSYSGTDRGNRTHVSLIEPTPVQDGGWGMSLSLIHI